MRRLMLCGAAALVSCARVAATTGSSAPARAPNAPSTTAPATLDAWRGLLGEYDTPRGMRVVLEDNGRLLISDTTRHSTLLTQQTSSDFGISSSDSRALLGVSADLLHFVRDPSGHATEVTAGTSHFGRREIEPRPGTNQLRVTPVRSVEQVRAEALAASPPREEGAFRPADLVELVKLDPGIHLEIRYATTNNFLGTRFYDQARAFMQRPAAEAVVRAHRALQAQGFGLLIHDAYRPWYVTKMFWDATPLDKRWLVADPSQGSKHNRGAAVDLTLYDLSTGQAVEMPSTYDESTDRAFANYPGGTTAQRWRRAVLRRAMEAQGFTVNPTEWWHFDYKDWRSYAIGNIAFDKLP